MKLMGLMADEMSPISSCISYHLSQLPHTPCPSPTSLSRGDNTTYTKRVRISQICGCRTFVWWMYFVHFEFSFHQKKRKKLICSFSSLAASLHPNLFHSLVLIDSLTQQPQSLSDMKITFFFRPGCFKSKYPVF